MSSFANSQTGSEPSPTPARQSFSPAASIDPLEPLFLMINSLEVGGSERQFVELARSLRADHLQVHLGCVQKKGAFLEGLGELHEFRLGGSLYGLQSIGARWRLRRCLRKLGISVTHAFDFYSNLTLIPAALLARVPVVIGSHRQLGDLLTPSQFRAQLMMFRWCDRVVCNSRAAANSLLQAGLPERKVAVIGNALPPEAFAETTPALARSPGMVRVGMIARMNASYKNHREFLRAAARLGRRLSHVEFLLIGDGALRPALERQASELGLDGRVQFLGDRRDIAAVLAGIDVSVVPSASESLSNVMLESMAAGVPVVATHVGGNSELAGDGRGVLVAPNDEEALAAGIESVLSHEEFRLAISRRAREFAKANFSVERIRGEYCSVYAEALASRGNRSRLSRETRSETGADSRIRVAFVAPTLRYVGGQAVQADLLMRNWKADPDIAPRFIAVDPHLPRGLGWVARVPFLRTIVREPMYLLSLWQDLKDVDIAHIFSASYSSFLLAPLPAWWLARLRGKRTLINYRSGECRDHLQKSAIAREALRKTDRIVVPSGFLVDVMREFGLEAQIVPNIVDLSQFRYRLRSPLRPHLVCTRGFHPYYGIDVVVRAFAEVQRSYPQAQLDLVGGGVREGQIRDLVEQLNLPGIHFLGVASHSQIGQFYDRADIFVNASNLDNMPVSVLEAFASGTPVVTTAPESMRYMVDHGRTGLLSEPGDAGALARNILMVLGDSCLATRLAQNAFLESHQYSWESVRDQWLKMYLDLMPRGGKPEEVLARRV
ncbi:MAG: glycosyltransferase [Candidatus Sulfotelmatobacter sp.]